jgi:hypothetical protein
MIFAHGVILMRVKTSLSNNGNTECVFDVTRKFVYWYYTKLNVSLLCAAFPEPRFFNYSFPYACKDLDNFDASCFQRQITKLTIDHYFCIINDED